MKKIVILAIAMAGLTQALQAQDFGFQKGDVFAEGAIGVSTQDNKNTEIRTSNFNISPVVGYFVTDKFAVGLRPGYNQSKTTDYSGNNDVYTQTDAFGIGAFGRYYLLEAGTRFKAYGELDLGYSSQGGKSSNGTATTKLDKTNIFGANAGIGANFFLTQNIAVGYQFANLIGFTSSKVDNGSAKAKNSFSLNLNNFNNFFSAGQFSLTFKL